VSALSVSAGVPKCVFCGVNDVCAQLPDAPLYYSLPTLCSVIKVRSPPTNVFLSGLVNAGYKVGVCAGLRVCVCVCM
jgi:tRNA G26 N,N-dimethylase Trm1